MSRGVEAVQYKQAISDLKIIRSTLFGMLITVFYLSTTSTAYQTSYSYNLTHFCQFGFSISFQYSDIRIFQCQFQKIDRKLVALGYMKQMKLVLGVLCTPSANFICFITFIIEWRKYARAPHSSWPLAIFRVNSDQFQHLANQNLPNLLYIFNGTTINNLQKCLIFKKQPTNL